MSSSTLLIVILSIVVISFLFEQILELLNLKAQRKEVPEEVASFYDIGKYMKSLSYHRETTLFSFITSTFGFGLSIVMLALGGFGWLDGLLRNNFTSEIPLALAFF